MNNQNADMLAALMKIGLTIIPENIALRRALAAYSSGSPPIDLKAYLREETEKESHRLVMSLENKTSAAAAVVLQDAMGLTDKTPGEDVY